MIETDCFDQTQPGGQGELQKAAKTGEIMSSTFQQKSWFAGSDLSANTVLLPYLKLNIFNKPFVGVTFGISTKIYGYHVYLTFKIVTYYV